MVYSSITAVKKVHETKTSLWLMPVVNSIILRFLVIWLCVVSVLPSNAFLDLKLKLNYKLWPDIIVVGYCPSRQRTSPASGRDIARWHQAGDTGWLLVPVLLCCCVPARTFHAENHTGRSAIVWDRIQGEDPVLVILWQSLVITTLETKRNNGLFLLVILLCWHSACHNTYWIF